MPRTQEQFEEIRAQSREKILDAALRLFAERGFHSTSISQIAKEAGVAKGLIYNYFEKKEDLILGIVQEAMELGNNFLEEMGRLGTAKEKLRYVLNTSFDMITEQRDYYKLLMSLSLQLEEFPEIEKVVLGKYEGYMHMFKPLLEEIGMEDPLGETQLLGALMDGIGMQYMVLGKDYPLEEIRSALMKKYHLE